MELFEGPLERLERRDEFGDGRRVEEAAREVVHLHAASESRQTEVRGVLPVVCGKPSRSLATSSAHGGG